MCGISGLISFDKNVYLNDGKLKASVDVLKHRGPDDNGIFSTDGIYLSHVRLSILDLSSSGHQPMHSKSDRYVITYNGEVYNFRDLAERYNITTRSSSDTEVILELFEKIGVEMFSMLNGMFAFCIVDKQLKKAWLVRDRLGIKPLYLKKSDKSVFFSSEIKSIIAMTGETHITVHKKVLNEWCHYGNSLGTNTLYSDVVQLLPGEYLEIDLIAETIKSGRYWSVASQVNHSKCSPLSMDAMINKTKILLEQGVSRQLVSDVPVGVFLSGGIDSSAITAFASKNYSGKLTTYSVAFDFQKERSELERAKSVATSFNTEHNEVFISGTDVAEIVEKMVYHNDGPFSDAANIPLYLLSDNIKNSTKVVLQGDGGDELFGGYQRYNTLSRFKYARPLSLVGKFLNGLLPGTSAKFRRERFFSALSAQTPEDVMALLLTVEQTSFSPAQIFSDSLYDEVSRSDPFRRYREVASALSQKDILDRMLAVDTSIILPDIFLQKVDRATMAASVEVRVPFLDHDLVDFCLSLPADLKLRGGIQKWLLKKSLEGTISNDILYGKKQGFGVPYEYWIKSSLLPYLKDNLSDFYRKYPDVLSPSRIDSIIQSHKSGSRDHGFLLWKLLNLVVWGNQVNLEF
ncbi:asparagine synthase (glutamine-hydrolyzing) [Arsukibacterium sp.]|uniref:asparagine synthase (glutamine-hydrolyzing) n=1 Tax=Arsukibacterium sp. TaxID=1977258 RepID=UPI00299D3CA8|nr:asparagine synthase (glutamine-hydrolyzing) [Arsukibacterium sp.]MDX1538545.1 asparagine synthase (glutamine-hydrolyzing) [Arsukibacterium sp.]